MTDKHLNKNPKHVIVNDFMGVILKKIHLTRKSSFGDAKNIVSNQSAQRGPTERVMMGASP